MSTRGPSRQRWLLVFITSSLRVDLSRAKGCFSHDAEISMADGSRRQLRVVRPGDEVVSWDEGAQRVTKSVVQAVPSYHRDGNELVEVVLPHGAFLATVDHPFWSRSRQGLVSVHPAGTMRDYGLHAEAFSHKEDLEGERNGTVHNVTATWQRLSLVALLRGRRRLAASLRNGALEVATLCLHPFHWFYVHGVRVHNKGCFVKTTEVSMASGLKKQLQHVQVGEQVVSWDSENQRVAKSTVVVAPTYTREAKDLVEIRLPHVRIHATEDHPFWSKSRGALVSAHPNRTMEEYSLHAHALIADEVLEGEQLEGVRVSDIVRPPESALLRGRRLSNSTSDLEVMTLCLHPYPWFYVHGVRVHNKGCFAPWVRVLLSNGTQAPISSIRAEDRVVSWDAAEGTQVNARVLAVEEFPTGGQLIELNFEATSAVRRLGQHSGLVLTADHPVYSARSGEVVSMQPGATLASYNLQTGQLQRQELLRHYLGHNVEALAHPWLGERPPVVVTLRLEQYHWFYAEGVRVHNKGGGYGGSGSSAPVYRSRSYFGTQQGFAMFILAHDRRRRGYWTSGDGCTYSADGGSTAGVQQLCSRTVGQMSNCERCDQCTEDACVNNIGGCSSFLSGLYSECKEEGPSVWNLILGVLSLVVATMCCIHCIDSSKTSAVGKERQQRMAMTGNNGQGLIMVVWKGSYTENGETKAADYRFQFESDGDFSGTGTDDDGVAQVRGVMAWSLEANVGQIRWEETRPGVTIEANGTLSYEQGPQGPMMWLGTQNTGLYLHATYVASSGVNGSTTLRSTEMQTGNVGFASQRQEETVPLRNYAA